MNAVQTATEKKRFWVPLVFSKDRGWYLPAWISHILFTLSLGGLIVSILIVSGLKREFQPFAMIRTHKSEIASSRSPNESAKENHTPAYIFQSAASKIIHSIARPMNINKIKPVVKESVDNIEIQKAAIPPPNEYSFEQQKSVLEKIWTDPKRIYLDKKFTSEDIVFEFRNVSEYGMEIYAYNQNLSGKTYYFPKVVIGDAVSSFDGGVLVPGSGRHGWIVVPDIRKKRILTVEMSAVGGNKIKEKLNLDW